MKKISGGEALIQAFIKEGVKIVFGYPGGSIIPFYDNLYDYQDKIHHVLVRHEQGAAHAAEGYARVSGKVGVCISTSGPGATNLVTGIADAMMDSVPIVCITGQVAANLVGSDAFQETDVVGVTTPITKWNYLITKAEEIPYVIKKAFYIASTGRPGPVVIDITKNAQSDLIDEFVYPKTITIPSYNPNLEPHIRQIQQAAEMINQAKRPLIVAGHGVEIAHGEIALKQLAETAHIPVACTLLGLSTFPADHPLHVGMVGMHGNYAANVLTNESDVIIAIGMRFDDRVTAKLSGYAPKSKIIHIDVDPAEINKNVKVDLPIVADARLALEKLCQFVKKNSHHDWLKEFNRLQKIEEEKVTSKQTNNKNKQLKMGEVVRLLSNKTRGEAIIVADVGQNQMFSAKYYQYKKPRSYITSGGHGTMGYGLPAAIGAKFADVKRQVFAIVGDGGFQMMMQQLMTITQEKLPIKIIIMHNQYLGMVRQWLQLYYKKRYSAVNLKNPDFIQIAKGFFIKGEKVSQRQELDAALDRLIAAKQAYILEVVVEQEDNIFPMIPPGESIAKIRLE